MTFGSTLNSDMTSRARASKKCLALRGQYTSTSVANLDEGGLPDAADLSLMGGPSGVQGPTSLEGSKTPVVTSSRGSQGDGNSSGGKSRPSSSSFVEGVFGDSSDDQGKDEVYDYYDLPLARRATFFERYSEDMVKVPSEVLHFSISLTDFAVERKARMFRLSQPYSLRAPGPMERVCFPQDGEVGVYLDFFEVGLRFPLDEDLAIILRHYRLPLRCYSLSSIRLMIVFLSLIRTIQVPFSLSVFRHMYRLRVVRNKSWATFAARSGLGVIKSFSKIDPNWMSRFVFMKVPEDFCLPRSWISIDGFRDLNSHMSEADSVCLGVLSNAALLEVRYPDLMSESSLAKVGLIFPSQNPAGEENFVRTSLVASDDDDGMRMLGSMLDLASQQLGAISLKKSRPFEEGARFSSPPLTPGTTIPGDEYHLPEGYLNWFDPPFPLDPSRSYFN